MTVSLLLLAAIKAGVLLGAALLYCTLSRRSPASQKHLVCVCALAGTLLLPVLTVALPQWFTLPTMPPSVDAAAASGFPIITAAWLTGIGVLALRGARRQFRARRVVARCREIRDARLLTAAIRARREIGTNLPIRLVTGAGIKVPMTTGIFRPTLLLPEAAISWSLPRLRAILLHETAHLARRDALVGVLTGAACAVWWFHPLSWLVAGRLRLFREVACDDRVVMRGARRSGYAALLLDCFERFRGVRPALDGAAVLGDRHELRRRVQSLVDARTRRRTPPGRARAVVLGAVLLTLALATSGRAALPSGPGSCVRCNRTHTRTGVSVTVGVHARSFTTRR